jgi:PAS domain-containing protein
MIASTLSLFESGQDRLQRRFRCVHADGSLRWLDEVAAAERDPSTGQILYLYGTLRDVTREVEAEHNQKVLNQRYELATTAAGLAVSIVDYDSGEFIYNNPLHARLHYRPSEQPSASLFWSRVLQGREAINAAIA